MSNIKKTDVKNHLSPRFRTKLHLCQPQTQPDAPGFLGVEPAGADPANNGSMEKPLNLPSTGGRGPLSIVTSKSAQD